MSIFFDKRPSVQTTWKIKKTPPNVDDTTAVLNRFLWDTLTENLNPSPPLCISVTPVQFVPNPHSFLCWALLNENNDSEALEIPPAWSTIYQKTFSGTDVILKLGTPTILTVVIATALSCEAYSQACANQSALDEWLSFESRILRQGDVLSVPKKKSKLLDTALRYRLDMLEPVLQGHAERGTTKVIVALSQTDTAMHDSAMAMDTEGEQDAIEIDESFLGSSISNLSPDVHTCSAQTSPLDPYKNEVMERSSPRFSYKSMLSPFKLAEDHYTLFFRTSDLGKNGILNGDWAVAGVAPSKYRLVRVLAKDALIDSAGCLMGSPLLLHNILSNGRGSDPQAPSSIHVRRSPFGAANPPIPVARSVTIARVASSNSINRQYQPLFLHSLRKYFDAGKRLVKQNDIIAVSIDTDLSRWLEATGDDSDHHLDLKDLNHPSSEPRANGLVFFKVTSIEYDVVSKSSPPLQDLYMGSALGELGCWIDTSITRMTQAGVEHTRVPDVTSYMQIDTASSTILRTLESLPVSHLLGPKSTFSRLLALSSAALSQRTIEYNLHLSFLLKGGRGIGKFTVVAWVSQRLGLNLHEINCYNILGENDVKTEAMLRVKFEQASTCTPCLLVLRHLEALTQTTHTLEGKKDSPIVTALRECIDSIHTSWKATGHPLIVIGTTSASSLPVAVVSCFKQEILFEAPNEGERLEILRCLLSNVLLASDVSLQHLATQTAALLAGDLHDLVARAKAASVDRAMNTTTLKENSSILPSISITASDFDIALGKARHSYSESIGAPKIPNVTWDDVGGLGHIKSEILDTIQLPLDRPDLFRKGMKKRSGVLLYGPPGTGKTLVAKAIATSCSMNFFSVKGPELLNMYIGESEANVRRIFQRARDAKPCVIFFDELDSVAPKRGNHGDSGGVMDRIVSQLLAELDGMSGGKESANVFVIGATNRPDLLDPALLRPGRFDRMLYLGVSDSHEAQLNILEALTRKFRVDPDLNLRAIAQKCPLNLTGADFYALCSDAMLNAMSRKAEGIDAKISVLNGKPGHHGHPHPVTAEYYLAELASAEDMAVHVSQEDFDRALDCLVPSVSQAEMELYGQIQKRFSQGAVDEIGSSES